jgi:DNA-binding XRE family transcriptional regulator
MPQKQLLTEKDLAALAKRFRMEAGKSRSEAGRDLGVSHVSIHRAEENPEESLLKLRVRMIEAYSPFRVTGPVFYLEKKNALPFSEPIDS